MKTESFEIQPLELMVHFMKLERDEMVSIKSQIFRATLIWKFLFESINDFSSFTL